MLPFLRWSAITILGMSVSACATMMVSSHTRRDIEVAQYRTFDWGPPDALPTGDPRLDANPFFHDHMQGAVERQLAARGIELSSSGAPDLLIHYHANVTQRVDVNRIDPQYGNCYGEDCRVRVMEYEAATLVLDVVDSRTNRVVWRGWAQDSFVGVIDHPDRLQRMIDTAVERMLDRFPRPL
jgi:hypothetical protein